MEIKTIKFNIKYYSNKSTISISNNNLIFFNIIFKKLILLTFLLI
jgi:hypothetical protein